MTSPFSVRNSSVTSASTELSPVFLHPLLSTIRSTIIHELNQFQ